MLLEGYEFHDVGSLRNDPFLDVVHGLILHVDAGNAVSLWQFFDGPSGGIESHVHIPKSAVNPKEQFRDTQREADANNKANSWIGTDSQRHGFLSAETQGYGGGYWTKYQLDSIKELIMVTHKEHKYPLQECPGPKRYGVGYHTQYPSWTNVPGKTCPGANRIEQYHTIIVPWLDEQRALERVKFYTVLKGDTVNVVSDKFDLPVWKLWKLNPDIEPPFKPGMKVRIR